MRGRIVRSLTGVLVLAWMVALPRAAVGGRARMDKRAEEVLRSMSSYLGAMQSFELIADATFDRVLEGGQKLESRERVRMAVRRPNALAEDVEGATSGRTLRYDGSRFTVVETRQKLYASVAAPDTIDATLSELWGRYDLAVPLAELALADPYAALAEKIESGIYVGQTEVDGRPVHHLAFGLSAVDWQIWIDAGDQPAPLRMVITYKTIPQAPQYRVDFVSWRPHAVLSDREFAFVVPEDAEEIPLLANDTGLSGDLP